MSLKAGHEAATNIGAAAALLYLQTSERSNIPVDLLRWIVDRRPRNVFLRSSRHYDFAVSLWLPQKGIPAPWYWPRCM